MVASSANFSKPGVFGVRNFELQRVSYYFQRKNPRVSNRRIGTDFCAWSTRAVSIKPLASFDFETKVFKKEKEKVKLAGLEEYVVRGGRDLFPLLPETFKGIKQIGVIASDMETLDQARKLKNSLTEVNSDIVVKIGLRSESIFLDNPRRAGFTEENGTLGNICEIVSGSDFVLLSDVEHEEVDTILAHMKPHSIFGLCYGFFFRHSLSTRLNSRNDVSVILVSPKGVVPFESKPYIQVEGENGVGIGSGFVVYQDVDGRATNAALGWSIALGSFTFLTTLEQEYRNHYSNECGIQIIDVPSKNIVKHITKKKSKTILEKVELFINVTAVNVMHVINNEVIKPLQEDLYTSTLLMYYGLILMAKSPKDLL